MDDLDGIVRRLAAITDELLTLGPESYNRRFELEIERDELRARAKTFAERKDQRRTIFELESELASRRSQLKELNKSKINMLYQAQAPAGHTMAISSRDGGTINNAMMKAQGAAQLITRIGEIESELAHRGYDVPSTD